MKTSIGRRRRRETLRADKLRTVYQKGPKQHQKRPDFASESYTGKPARPLAKGHHHSLSSSLKLLGLVAAAATQRKLRPSLLGWCCRSRRGGASLRKDDAQLTNGYKPAKVNLTNLVIITIWIAPKIFLLFRNFWRGPFKVGIFRFAISRSVCADCGTQEIQGTEN